MCCLHAVMKTTWYTSFGARLLLLLSFSWAPLCLGDVAKLILLPNAVEMGAICLDGSPPGYYWRPGSGDGANSWIVHLEGGGWCYNEDDCVARSKTSLGSSKFWPENATFYGFLSDDKEVNPDFYDWNVAFVKYCDGASFAGNLEKPLVWNGTTLHFRGWTVLQANLDSLLTRGMHQAKEVILTGCSAGGLATYLHADFVHGFIPSGIKFRAMADAGYFIDGANISRYMHIRSLYQYVFEMQNCSSGVNHNCVRYFAAHGGETWRCFFSQYSFPHTKASLFILNSQYDTWQLENILQLGCTPPDCPQSKMEDFYHFRNQFLSAVASSMSNETTGVFLDSCLVHCQSLDNNSWTKYLVNGAMMRDTFAHWYFGTDSIFTKQVDCAYPCNASC